jgi:hypothetical protein
MITFGCTALWVAIARNDGRAEQSKAEQSWEVLLG